MIAKLLDKLSDKGSIKQAQAHCDIPCGIYDPITAQISALTVIRMIDLMNGLDSGQANSLEYQNSMSRYVQVKEDHAVKCKEEIGIIWGDYVKAPIIEKHPDIHSLVHKILQLGSKVKQTVSRETALELLQEVNKFAEIFWATKGIKTKKAKAPYAPNEEVVYPDL